MLGVPYLLMRLPEVKPPSGWGDARLEQAREWWGLHAEQWPALKVVRESTEEIVFLSDLGPYLEKEHLRVVGGKWVGEGADAHLRLECERRRKE